MQDKTIFCFNRWMREKDIIAVDVTETRILEDARCDRLDRCFRFGVYVETEMEIARSFGCSLETKTKITKIWIDAT